MMEDSPATFVFGHWGTSSESTMQSDFPVHRACRDGDVAALDSLLASGRFSVYDEDSFYGWTPAHWAAYFGRLDCLMRVIQFHCNNGNGALSSPATPFAFSNLSVDLQTKRFGQTPSHVAAFAGNAHCLKWLLHCGAALDRQDYLGETSLHKAARTGSLECTHMLTSHAADIDVRNKNGQTPKDLARACGYLSIADYLNQVAKNFPRKGPPRPGGGAGDQTEDEAMETCEAVQSATPTSHVAPEGDVLLNGAIAANFVPVGGKKRQRRNEEESVAKRLRLSGAGDFVPDLRSLFDSAYPTASPPAAPPAVPPAAPPAASPSAQPSASTGFAHPALDSQSAPPTNLAEAEVAQMRGHPLVSFDRAEATRRSFGSEAFVAPRASSSTPDLRDKSPMYPGSLEFGHFGVASPEVHRGAVRFSGVGIPRPVPPEEHGAKGVTPAASSAWTEHCDSVASEQAYRANYSRLLADEMFMNIHGC